MRKSDIDSSDESEEEVLGQDTEEATCGAEESTMKEEENDEENKLSNAPAWFLTNYSSIFSCTFNSYFHYTSISAHIYIPLQG